MEDGYLDFVQKQAGKLFKLFMLDSGEGNDFEYEEKGWYVEELSGWLIEPKDKTLFLQAREVNTLDELFKEDFVWVKWKIVDNKLFIEFQKLPVQY